MAKGQLNSIEALYQLSTEEPVYVSNFTELEIFLRKRRVFVNFLRVFEGTINHAGIDELPADNPAGFALHFQNLEPPTNPLATLHASVIGRYSLQLPQIARPSVNQLYHRGWSLTATRDDTHQSYNAVTGFDNAQIVPEVIKMAATDLLAVAATLFETS